MALERFWRHVGAMEGLYLHHVALAELVPEAEIPPLVNSGLLLRRPLEADARFTCAAPVEDGCRVIVEETDSGALALRCSQSPAQCARRLLKPEERWTYRLDKAGLVSWLARSLGAGVPEVARPRWDRPVPLGVRSFEDQEWHFFVVMRPEQVDDDQVMQLVRSAGDGRLVVVLACDLGQVPGRLIQKADPDRLVWLGLSSAFDVVPRARLNLSSLYLRRRPRGVDWGEALWPPYMLVHVEGTDEFFFKGRPLALAKRPRARRLLGALVKEPGAVLPRKESVLAIWQEAAEDGFSLDDRYKELVKVRLEVRKAFRDLVAPGEVEVDPIETIRGHDDNDHGDRLSLPVTQVCVLRSKEC